MLRLPFSNKEDQQKRALVAEIESKFGGRLGPGMAEALAGRPNLLNLAPERRLLTVLEARLRGFDELASRLEPARVVDRMRPFLEVAMRVLHAEAGFPDRFAGAAVRALFGAPIPSMGDAAQACRAAIALRENLRELKNAWANAGEPLIDRLVLSAALATGEATVGYFGTDAVFDYGAVGPPIDLAARLDRLNALYGTTILASEETARSAGDSFQMREVARVRLAPGLEPIVAFEVVGFAPASPADRQRLVRFQTGLAAFRAREFLRAERLFASILEDFGGDPPAAIYADRCRRYRTTPPPDAWDGTEFLPG